ncbi:MAG: hypothetical protein GY754_31490, partial [bacterium]|nr:hypothetical protein [bacterium]
MKKFLCIGVLVVLVLAFAGCEAGLTSDDSSGEGNDFSFSDMYERINVMEPEIKELKKEIQNLKAKTSPPGTINPFAGENVPEGWLLCDGQAYGRTEYSELFQVIGTAWGSPDDSRFNVPDLQGVFLRGVDRGTGKDPDAGSRVAIMPRGNTGNNVGSYQDDVFQGHKHHTSNGMNIGGDGTGFPWG